MKLLQQYLEFCEGGHQIDTVSFLAGATAALEILGKEGYSECAKIELVREIRNAANAIRSTPSPIPDDPSQN